MLAKTLWFLIPLVLSFSVANTKEVVGPEKCFLYPVGGTNSNFSFDLKDNQETNLSVYLPNGNQSFQTYIRNHNSPILKVIHMGECILGIFLKNSNLPQCQKNVKYRGETILNSLVVKQGKRLQWKMVTYINNYTLNLTLASSQNTLKLETEAKHAINVYFDCPQGCFEFEKASIPQSKDAELSIYGMEIDPAKTMQTAAKIIVDESEGHSTYLSGEWTHINQSIKHDRWYHIQLETPRETYGPLYDLYGYFAPKFQRSLVAKEVNISGNYYILDFSETSNIRWSTCLSQRMYDIIRQTEESSEKLTVAGNDCIIFVYITMPIIYLLVLICIAMGLALCWIIPRASDANRHGDFELTNRPGGSNQGEENGERTGYMSPLPCPAFGEFQNDPLYDDLGESNRQSADHIYDEPNDLIAEDKSEHIYEELEQGVYCTMRNK